MKASLILLVPLRWRALKPNEKVQVGDRVLSPAHEIQNFYEPAYRWNLVTKANIKNYSNDPWCKNYTIRKIEKS